MPDWLIIVAAGLALVVLTPFARGLGRFLIRALAAAIVFEINGSLELPELREEVAGLSVQMTNLEKQIEPLIQNH